MKSNRSRWMYGTNVNHDLTLNKSGVSGQWRLDLKEQTHSLPVGVYADALLGCAIPRTRFRPSHPALSIEYVGMRVMARWPMHPWQSHAQSRPPCQRKVRGMREGRRRYGTIESEAFTAQIWHVPLGGFVTYPKNREIQLVHPR